MRIVAQGLEIDAAAIAAHAVTPGAQAPAERAAAIAAAARFVAEALAIHDAAVARRTER